MFSHNLLRRFVKDFSLPIQLVQKPYFDYYLDLYDDVFGTKNLFRMFAKDEVIKAVTSTAKYQEFNNDKLERFSVPGGIEKGSIYNPDNDGRYFVSFDLKKANYNALKFYHPDIVFSTRTYDEFIEKFTDLEYFKKSKYIRQVIFGNLNPKKQAKIQRYIIRQLLEVVSLYFPEDKIKEASHDEIVVAIEAPEEYLANTEFRDALFEKVNDLGIELNSNVFSLRQLKPYPYYVKEYYNEKRVEFKAVPSLFMPQVIKHYFGRSIEDYDLFFYHEGQIAKFITPISFSA